MVLAIFYPQTEPITFSESVPENFIPHTVVSCNNDLLPGCRWTAESFPVPCHHTGSHATCTYSGMPAS